MIAVGLMAVVGLTTMLLSSTARLAAAAVGCAGDAGNF
jgi:hypothetical protein